MTDFWCEGSFQSVLRMGRVLWVGRHDTAGCPTDEPHWGISRASFCLGALRGLHMGMPWAEPVRIADGGGCSSDYADACLWASLPSRQDSAYDMRYLVFRKHCHALLLSEKPCSFGSTIGKVLSNRKVIASRSVSLSMLCSLRDGTARLVSHYRAVTDAFPPMGRISEPVPCFDGSTRPGEHAM